MYELIYKKYTHMAKNLVIVESPAKWKTIEKFLWKDYQVVASMGHIRDLPQKSLWIDIENNFTPEYWISEDKEKTVNNLKKLAKWAETVWIATDEDREWEAIGWHLCQALDLDPKVTQRIVFHEITKTAILKAVENPRTIDIDLVDAQQARRAYESLSSATRKWKMLFMKYTSRVSSRESRVKCIYLWKRFLMVSLLCTYSLFRKS